ncbi:hypothetical protein SEA_RYADEL_28 [Mycobacterium phage Ryadel]|uniref:Uncharacterized protein n=2 Tax=Corndogvirus TaxID=1623285 RepID=A0A345MF00_9CAUD|nr:hypothetical protein PBI_CATDAWG_25 [Mycobacterium phage Catdawg]YP_010097518.1 hypothetical protein KNU03_gp028 [Mycobacterium phage Ryadel]ATW60508.1 hypothetical protein SEA_FAMILTON_26 [Mycobacterium phage Familton]AVI04056.1 hypothetical protein SEA_JANGDYNASTY_25 [Mycobacterium phage JangDynasty]AVP42680.1 hypothetical protein SEA_SCHOOLBUS_25 [Mycobacterium phage SchoolBus]QFP97072.1 hypothetical protein SEA_KRILI_26 [Mycobacterium phage Krili]QGJ87348.1 hypothetical protein SEA_BLE
MSHLHLIVDRETAFEGNLNLWQATPPDYFKDKLREDVNPEQWLKCVMIVMAEAAATGENVKIIVTTGRDWQMEVRRYE